METYKDLVKQIADLTGLDPSWVTLGAGFVAWLLLAFVWGRAKRLLPKPAEMSELGKKVLEELSSPEGWKLEYDGSYGAHFIHNDRLRIYYDQREIYVGDKRDSKNRYRPPTAEMRKILKMAGRVVGINSDLFETERTKQMLASLNAKKEPANDPR